jgi:hypothetical protein
VRGFRVFALSGLSIREHGCSRQDIQSYYSFCLRFYLRTLLLSTGYEPGWFKCASCAPSGASIENTIHLTNYARIDLAHRLLQKSTSSLCLVLKLSQTRGLINLASPILLSYDFTVSTPKYCLDHLPSFAHPAISCRVPSTNRFRPQRPCSCSAWISAFLQQNYTPRASNQ